jgi:hypothetical protein
MCELDDTLGDLRDQMSEEDYAELVGELRRLALEIVDDVEDEEPEPEESEDETDEEEPEYGPADPYRSGDDVPEDLLHAMR